MEQNKYKIGLVDDHQLILDGLEKLLQSVPDYEVVFIETKASIALQHMQKHRIDMVISDVAMPDMNGAEFIQKIKQHHPEVKILVLSTYKTDLIDQRQIDGYLLKESPSATILKKVNQILTTTRKSNSGTDKTHVSLSKREKEIVIEIGKGLSSEQIAEKLFLSYYTIETHKKNIYLKLNVKTTAELIKKAIYIGIIT